MRECYASPRCYALCCFRRCLCVLCSVSGAAPIRVSFQPPARPEVRVSGTDTRVRAFGVGCARSRASTWTRPASSSTARTACSSRGRDSRRRIAERDCFRTPCASSYGVGLLGFFSLSKPRTSVGSGSAWSVAGFCRDSLKRTLTMFRGWLGLGWVNTCELLGICWQRVLGGCCWRREQGFKCRRWNACAGQHMMSVECVRHCAATVLSFCLPSRWPVSVPAGLLAALSCFLCRCLHLRLLPSPPSVSVAVSYLLKRCMSLSVSPHSSIASPSSLSSSASSATLSPSSFLRSCCRHPSSSPFANIPCHIFHCRFLCLTPPYSLSILHVHHHVHPNVSPSHSSLPRWPFTPLHCLPATRGSP